VSNPGAGIFGSYFFWSNHDDANFTFVAEELTTKDIAFENTKINSFNAYVKLHYQNGRDILTVRGTGVRTSVITLLVDNVVMEFTHPDEIAEINANPNTVLANAGGMQTFIAGENKIVNVYIKNANCQYGMKQLFNLGHSVNMQVNCRIDNFYAIDALDFHTGGTVKLNTLSFFGNGLGVRIAGHNTTVAAFRNSKFSVKMGNVYAPWKHLFLSQASRAEGGQVDIDVDNAEMYYGNVIDVIAPTSHIHNAGVLTDISIKGKFKCIDNVCILSSGIMAPTEFVRYRLSGTYETTKATSSVVNVTAASSATMLIDGVSTVTNAGSFILDNATLLTPNAGSVTHTNAGNVVIKNSYSNKPVSANTTQLVGTLIVDPLVK
jgi:hypothetical protein